MGDIVNKSDEEWKYTNVSRKFHESSGDSAYLSPASFKNGITQSNSQGNLINQNTLADSNDISSKEVPKERSSVRIYLNKLLYYSNSFHVAYIC